MVSNAKIELSITYHPKPEARRDRQAWTGERIALLGFLAGRGWAAKRIAEHPMIRSTEGNVYKQAHRFNIALCGSSQGELVLRRIPASARAALEHLAERAQLTREALAVRLLLSALTDPDKLAAVA